MKRATPVGVAIGLLFAFLLLVFPFILRASSYHHGHPSWWLCWGVPWGAVIGSFLFMAVLGELFAWDERVRRRREGP